MNQPTRVQKANALRVLSIDGVQAANSGHPGMPMGMADLAEVLWCSHLNHNPANPKWANRDRFVLSNGHGSMLLYSLLHLTGYDVSLNDLKNFRQLHSKTPGHPELGYTPGVEITTGPLGQGLANSVGFALAESMMAAEFNKPDFPIVDHYTYCFVGDGCLMEGISHEAASIAGTWNLNKLIVLYDDNGISIDGEVEGWFTDNTPERFKSYGWNVIEKVDGHDAEAINAAIEAAKSANAPTLICCQTVIGHGAPTKAGTHDCHGAPLGDAEIKQYKENIDWPTEAFALPEGIRDAWDAREAGANKESAWNKMFTEYAIGYPELADAFKRRMAGELPENWTEAKASILKQAASFEGKQATRKSSQDAINLIKPYLSELTGGSADLAPSNLTLWKDATSYSSETPEGKYFHFGVREFGMTAIVNGMVAYGGLKCFSATFLMFMEYARNAVRMAALMKLPSIFVYTHDSIGLGEDGPTHQPVEQIASLRGTPNLDTWRPCDHLETITAWLSAIEQSDRPSALCLTRQGVPPLSQTIADISDIEKGGYVLKSMAATPDVIVMASGSEVSLGVEVANKLAADHGLKVNVVSVPCMSRFDAQSSEYKAQVLPNACRQRIAIEAGSPQPWHKYVGLDGQVFGIDTFGESAPANELYAEFGLTVEQISSQTEALFKLGK